MEKKALITGITGQDGSYLAELLIDKNYEVHGIIRRSSSFNTQRIEHLYQDPHEKKRKLYLHYGELTDASNISRLIEKIEPDEIYNLGAQSHVKVSFEQPEYTSDVNAIGTLRLLDAIRESDINPKFYQASTSELFGKSEKIPQNEKTLFHPRSPYAISKLYSYWITINYREAYGLFACNGILFNHESPRRDKRFVTRKITRAVARISAGLQYKLYLGNLYAKRDWGYAPEYVKAMWMMLDHNTPSDLVIATGESHSVKEFVERSFQRAGYTIIWKGKGIDEKGVDADSKKTLIEIDQAYFRPSEVDFLLGDPTKAEKEIGWKSKTNFEDLVHIMVDADIKILKEKGEIALDYFV